MARMSVDDSILRSPGVLRIAKALGWHRHRVIGAILDVWAICYDRVTPVIGDPIDIDTAADHDGFALELVRVGLATETPDGLLIRGAAERIRYLEGAEQSGRRGGLASAAKRKADNEMLGSLDGGSRLPSGAFNLPDTATAPDPDPDRANCETDYLPGERVSPARQTSFLPDQGGSRTRTGNAQQRAAQPPKTGRGGADKEPPQEAVMLASLLMRSVVTNHPTNRVATGAPRIRESTTHQWALTIDKMNRLDKRDWPDIRAMIVWCQNEGGSRDQNFWSGTILGADSLRQHWDKMAAQRSAARLPFQQRRGPTAAGLDRVRMLEEQERRERDGGG